MQQAQHRSMANYIVKSIGGEMMTITMDKEGRVVEIGGLKRRVIVEK